MNARDGAGMSASGSEFMDLISAFSLCQFLFRATDTGVVANYKNGGQQQKRAIKESRTGGVSRKFITIIIEP